jgi:hypothetical protein
LLSRILAVAISEVVSHVTPNNGEGG